MHILNQITSLSRQLICILFLGLQFGFLPTSASNIKTLQQNDYNAVVLVFHRFGEDNLPTTNIRLGQLDDQIQHLVNNGHHFVSLKEMITKLKNNQPLPDKSLAITVDDAYASFALKGWPRFKKAGIPVTLFVSTDLVGASANYLNWDQIRQLKAEGVDIAHHGAAHLHLTDISDSALFEDIQRANDRFKKEIGFVPGFISYPYGEYSSELKNKLNSMGFEAAFAQYSGVIHSQSDLYELPRFPVNERFGNAARFKLITQAMAIPVKDVTPSNPILPEENNPPVYGFTLTKKYPNLKAMACYPSHLGKAADIDIIGDYRVEVRFDKPFPKGRNRINCTMPASGKNDKGRWFWLGKLFYIKGGLLD